MLLSTNLTAAELISPLVEKSPAIVLAAEQTAGRGRKGNAWWSAGGALTFSIVLDAEALELPAERRPLLSIAAGAAVRAALAEHSSTQQFAIKWPNDVYADQRKICGILAEQHNTGDQTGLVIGIGVNVNNSLQEAPAEVRQRAVSLYDLEHRVFDLTEILIAILRQLEAAITLAAQQPRRFLAEANFHHLLNQKAILVQAGEQLLAGKCLGIDEDGQLVLQSETQLHRICSGIVQRWC